jgi:endo-1,4-beta-xylanase
MRELKLTGHGPASRGAAEEHAACFRRRCAGSLLLLGLAFLVACGSDGPATPTPITPPTAEPLRTLAAQRGLWIGTAVGSNFPGDARYMQILPREFNLVVAENSMKFDAIQPSRGQFAFTRAGGADALVDYAVQNGMRIRGHTLSWHSQNPAWLTSGSWTREEAVQILEEHIATVVGRYRGRIYAWDAVNEAVNDHGVRRRTQSVWEQRIGADYIDIAFRAAAAADPAALLFYNDYNLEWPGAKQDSVFVLVRDLQQREIPIHGIGFQAHFQSGGVPSEQQLRATFDRFAQLGLRIHVTELDIRVQMPATQERLQRQADEYRRVVKVCMETPACDTVVVWGLHDGNSWVPQHFPGWGAALLYDESFVPKSAYFSVNDVLAGR